MSDLLLLFIGAFTGIFITAFWVGTSMRDRECEIFQKALEMQRRVADQEIDKIIDHLSQLPTEYCEADYNQGVYDAIKVLKNFRKKDTRWGL